MPTVSNLVQGPATLYRAVFGAAEPLDTAIAAVPAVGVWADLGGTDGGATLTIDQTYNELVVDQVVDIPEQRLVKRVVDLTVALAEPTLENLAAAMNITGPVTGAGVKSLEPTDDVSSTQPTYSAYLLDGWAPGGFRRRIVMRKCLQVDKVGMSYKKDGQTLVPAKFVAHYISASIKPVRILDATA